MKRNNLLPIFILLSGILFASCKKEVKEIELVQLEADIEDYGGEKAFVDNDNFSCFELNDKININGVEVTVNEVLYGGRTVRLNVATASTYKAVFPSSIVTTLSSGSTTNIPIYLPTSQMYETANGHQKVNIPMCGQLTTERGIIHFHNLCALLRLDITNNLSEPIYYKAIRVSTSNCPLSGSGKIDTISSDVPVIVMDATNTEKYVTLLFSSEQTLAANNGQATYYVVIPKAANASNFTVSILGRPKSTDPGYATRYVYERSKTNAPFSFDRNVIYSIPFTSPVKNEEIMSFKVPSGEKIMFSPGNLQWSYRNGGRTPTTHNTADGKTTASGTWRFAEHQWDFVGGLNQGTPSSGGAEGVSNKRYGTVLGCYNDSVKYYTVYRGWVDMFGWGTSGWNNTSQDQYSTKYAPWEMSQGSGNANNTFCYGPSINNSQYGPDITGTNYDWGVYNEIYNPTTKTTDRYGTWHTPSYDELYYLLYSRTDADKKHGHAKIKNVAGYNGAGSTGWSTIDVRGLIFLPDHWVLPDGVNFTPGHANGYSTNEYTQAQWQIMEQAGAIFLPAAGYRSYSNESPSMQCIIDFGDYHSSTCYRADGQADPGKNYIPYFTRNDLNQGNSTDFGAGTRWMGRSVRLIRTLP